MASYNLFSSHFHDVFGNLPKKDCEKLRKDTVDYIRKFDSKVWFDDPVRTVLNGKPVTHADDKVVGTPNAFGVENGKQVLSPPAVVDRVIDHLTTYKVPKTDLRKELREIEDLFLEGKYDAMIAGNQAIDFQKQDSVTEIEESCGACTVERRLNDALFKDEQAKKVTLCREPVFTACVSNFSTFLDLCRKTIRNIELGIPVVVLSRPNTGQHVYRWFQFLVEKLDEKCVDGGMLTFMSCDLEEQKRLTREFPKSPIFVTSSRETAKSIRKNPCERLVASTGGPNTMIATEFTPEVADAVRMSNLIENKGQCTALRQFICPTKDEKLVEKIYENASMISTPAEALEKGEFAALYKRDAKRFKTEEGYKTLDTFGNNLVHYRISDKLPVTINEMWREAYIDVTQPSKEELKSEKYIEELSRWLNHHQPISLAVNGDVELARLLFEKSALVVYTIGTNENPALTCQARPQQCETFGEFPPRKRLHEFSDFPVIIPSSTPGYFTQYTDEHLINSSTSVVLPDSCKSVEKIIDQCASRSRKGYFKLLVEYVIDACGPRQGHSKHTTLYGIQRPPLFKVHTVLRVEKGATLDDVVLYALPFLVTNAKEGFVISRSADAVDCSSLGVKVVEEVKNSLRDEAWNSITLPGKYSGCTTELPLVAHFVSLLFPMGHIKSVKKDDQDFLKCFKASKKWLRPLA